MGIGDGNLWRKSSFSGTTNCVEVAFVDWRKSSFSTTASNCVEVGWQRSSFSSTASNCVEVALQPQRVAVRDSKNTDGPMLSVPTATWQTFSALLRHDRVAQ